MIKIDNKLQLHFQTIQPITYHYFIFCLMEKRQEALTHLAVFFIAVFDRTKISIIYASK